MEIYDTILASTIEEGDFIFHSQDYIEVKRVTDETDTIMVSGVSHQDGDTVTYFIFADAEVGLWRY